MLDKMAIAIGQSHDQRQASEPKSWSARKEIDISMQYWKVSGGARGPGWREVPLAADLVVPWRNLALTSK